MLEPAGPVDLPLGQVYKQLGIDQNGRCFGQFEATGVRPTFVNRLEAAGIKLPSNLFQERVLLRD